MTTKRLPVRLKPARVRTLRPQHVPHLPEWFPLDPVAKGDEPAPPPYSDAQRRELRQRKAIEHACAGPFDGQRGLVVSFDTEQGPPPRYVPMNTPHVWYELDRIESDAHELVYRYDVSSPLHVQSIKAVEDAYRELSRDYTLTSREEADHERSAPKL